MALRTPCPAVPLAKHLGCLVSKESASWSEMPSVLPGPPHAYLVP